MHFLSALRISQAGSVPTLLEWAWDRGGRLEMGEHPRPRPPACNPGTPVPLILLS